jgi:hypothetical protein
LKSENIDILPILSAAIWKQFSSLPINFSLQNNPRYQFSLISENIEILPILSAAIRLRFFGQNILPTLLNIYAKSCGNAFGSFRNKWGQRLWRTLKVSMATAVILKIPRPECTSWNGDPPSCLVKIGSSLSENLVGKNRSKKRKKSNNNNKKKRCKNNKFPNFVWELYNNNKVLLYLDANTEVSKRPHIRIQDTNLFLTSKYS